MTNSNLLPRISIITVTKNNKHGLASTFDSIANQDYSNYEYIVIDGASIDGSDELINQYKHIVSKVIIEADDGIYHAMNKGISIAEGEWLLFMNAGDAFATESSLTETVSVIDEQTDVVYSDWLYIENGRLIKANIRKFNIRHQSVMYRKSLHVLYGNYVVGKKVSISDYIFFLSIRKRIWKYSKTPISICEKNGISANPSHFYQRIAAEMIFGKRSRLNGTLILLVYPFYRFLKFNVLRMTN